MLILCHHAEDASYEKNRYDDEYHENITHIVKDSRSHFCVKSYLTNPYYLNLDRLA